MNWFSLFYRKCHFDVLFYYPAHFNRDKNGNCPFLKPFEEICQKHGLRYLIIEEPVLFSKQKYKHNPNALSFRLFFFLVLVARKIIPLKRFSSLEEREWLIGKIFRILFFRNLKFDNLIVLSGSMVGFFRGINPNAEIFDYQHGLIKSNHPGYLTQSGEVPLHILQNRVKLLLYGNGFKEILQKRNKYYRKNSFVIGTYYSIEDTKIDYSSNKQILFSLQIVDTNTSLNNIILDEILNFLDENEAFFNQHELKIMFKSHPRFTGDVDIGKIEKFDFAELIEDDLFKVLKKSFLHITYSSTVTFDAASLGIPTLLLENTIPHEDFDNSYYFEDFRFPIDRTSRENFKTDISSYLSDAVYYALSSQKVKSWYSEFYQYFDENLLLSLLKVRNG